MRAARMTLVLLSLALSGALACGSDANGDGPGAGGSAGSSGSGGSGGTSAPPRETCGNRLDDDGDGADDYADADCLADEAFRDELQAVADDARGRVPALVVGVERPDGTVAFAASGRRVKGGEEPVLPDDPMPVGSITKTFTAVVVLQLRDEGRLSLDDTLDRWLPDFPRADQIELRHLLTHTSGIYPYTEDADFVDRMVAGDTFTVDEKVAIAATHDPLFAPGAAWSYSNSNYLLLGKVIEAVTGDTAAAALRTRIFTPLGMRDTLLLGAETLDGGLPVHGYLRNGAQGDLDVTDAWNGTAAWTDGAIVSTAADMLRFSHGLASGELVAPETFGEMVDAAVEINERMGYGYGLLLIDDFVGHDGATIGWMANWMRRSDGATVVTLQSRLDDAAAMNAAMNGALGLMPAP